MPCEKPRRQRPRPGNEQARFCSFVCKLERAVGRRLRPLPIGRPRKTKKKRLKKI